MRPVGSRFFGVFADRRGRRPALMAGILLMATGSMVIAIIPGRSAIGAWAVVILVLCWLVQGFATSGEYFLVTYLPKTTSPVGSFLLVAVSYIFLTGYTSINAIVKSELFPVHIRALGVGLGYAVANSAFGGTAPLIYEALHKANQIPAYIAYIMALTGISLLVYIFALRNKSSTYLDHEQGYAYKNSLPGSHTVS